LPEVCPNACFGAPVSSREPKARVLEGARGDFSLPTPLAESEKRYRRHATRAPGWNLIFLKEGWLAHEHFIYVAG
jgi:hypothetical protein